MRLAKCFPLELDEGMPNGGGPRTPNKRGLLAGTSREQTTMGGTRYIDSSRFTAVLPVTRRVVSNPRRDPQAKVVQRFT
jgi:hypothetical protein